ncbi:MAG: DNA polymerase IV [Candidatus Cloacimonetes bacterium]|nr:DNA polymerase IV [Candidatus Cloacimonadota bacterium]
MPQPKERVIALIDMDAFFASIEQRDNPALRGKPLFIAGSHTKKGVVTTCSYEARKYGCHSGMPVIEAWRRCPHGLFFPGSQGKYSYASMRILQICKRFTPVVEPFSIDEMFLDVSGCLRLFGSKRVIGEGIRGAVRDELDLPSSVGIAPNKLLAKLASKLAKPDGVYIIEPEDVSALMEDLPVESLFGVGEKTAEKLKLLGIHTAGQLGRYPADILSRKFGVGGCKLHRMGLGQDDSPVVAEAESERPKSISNETTFYSATNNPEHLLKVLLSLVHKVAFRLRKHDARARTVRLTVRTEDFVTHTHRHTLRHTIFFDTDLYDEICALFREVDTGALRIRLLGVGVSNLVFDEEPSQLRLFEDFDNRDVLTARAVDSIKKRFGESAIKIGDSRQTF